MRVIDSEKERNALRSRIADRVELHLKSYGYNEVITRVISNSKYDYNNEVKSYDALSFKTMDFKAGINSVSIIIKVDGRELEVYSEDIMVI